MTAYKTTHTLYISRGWGQIQVLWDLKSKQIGGGSLLENEYEITNITLNKKGNIYLVDKNTSVKRLKNHKNHKI